MSSLSGLGAKSAEFSGCAFSLDVLALGFLPFLLSEARLIAAFGCRSLAGSDLERLVFLP